MTVMIALGYKLIMFGCATIGTSGFMKLFHDYEIKGKGVKKGAKSHDGESVRERLSRSR